MKDLKNRLALFLLVQSWYCAGVCAAQSLTLEFKAKGVVCAMCVQSLRKHLLTEPGVLAVQIDIKTRRVLIEVEEGRSLTQDQLKKLVEESGFGFDGTSGG